MLDIALPELPARGSQQVLSGHRRSHRGQGHAVLQLVPEAVGAAGLVEPRPGPNAARECLIGQPAVEHDVHRPVGGLHLNRADDIVPEPPDIRQHRIQIGPAVAVDQRPRLGFIRSVAKEEDDLGDSVRRDLHRGLERSARVEARTGPPGEGSAVD